MTATSTRRAILASVAAVPALSLPVLASTETISFPELAKRLAAVYQRWLAQQTSDLAYSRAVDTAMEKSTGMSRAEWQKGWSFDMPQDERDARLATLVAAHEMVPSNDRSDESGASIDWNEIHDEMHPLIEEILQQPTRSLADLGIQLQAFALAESAVLLEGEDQVCSDRLIALMSTACAFCGVKALPGADHLHNYT